MNLSPRSFLVGLPASLRSHARVKGGGASRYAPYAAPAGWRWEFLTEMGAILTDAGVPQIELVMA